MPNGANSVHKQLRTELEDYIKSQYFGKSPLLLSALSDHIDDEGLLYQKPFIESSPAYVTVQNGIETASIEPWLKDYFLQLAEAGIGVFPSPFAHQISALEAATRGENLFVSTGTGSGKTECFMWPLLAKMADEARNSKESWAKRGVRTIVMYPMNALVSDQVSRLRRMIGDPDKKFIKIFRNTCGDEVRRPQFGMYTGRTPYPGAQPSTEQDRKLEKTLARMSFPQSDSEQEYFNHLLKEGKIPAKADMHQFLQGLHESRHIPNDEDAELITRFEMQQFCPDILITNYSMLEYMLLRPREQKIWDDTREWLASNNENKLLFVIDEAHMYRGSSGGEVALLIRRLFHKLGISRDRVQFILTTASMPNKNQQDVDSVMKFANELTASDKATRFCYLTGEREVIDGQLKYDIPAELLLSSDPSQFEDKDGLKLSALLSFWRQLEGFDQNINSLEAICNWMYDNLVYYRPFHELIKYCRGNAVSLGELSYGIFPDLSQENALKAVSVLLAIAPLAKNAKGSVLFPARMHMLFKGISGVYACANANCSRSHSEGGLTLGEVYLSDGNLICPHCGSVVYELYNDRRCGALFFKGYVLEDDSELHGNVYLWRYPGQLMDHRMKEVHLFIPTDEFELPAKQGKNAIKPCYLDVKSGFINFTDDSSAGKSWIRKLYYCNYSAKGRPQIITFPTCPHCRHQLSTSQLTSFSTRGNQSFFNLIKSQFQLQPAVPGKDSDPVRFPNEGRKVLLFSDSRQRAAKLARDMSDASDISAARQLFAIAIKTMEEQTVEQSMNTLYDYFCLAAGQRHVQMFHADERTKFAEDCASALNNYNRCVKRGRDYAPRFTIANAPVQMQEYLLRLFAGGYNTLYDSATSWIEPTDQALFDAVDALEENHVTVTDEEFINLFNAWILSICDMSTALGHTINDTVGEYAPGRAIVVDKQTYQIGGFYYPGSERHHGQSLTPARAYAEDPNYVKQIISCPECGWFGLMEENTKQCPFCGNDDLKITREMMRPWGFAPRNAEAIPDVQLSEEYTAVQQPLYSTLPDAEEMKLAPGCKNIRIASRTNQRIIMLNKGSDDKGFMVCKDCGAAMPGDDISVLNDVNRPYKSKYARSRCRHGNSFNVNLGYDFITDMLVLEFTIDDKVIDARRNDNPWLNRAAQSLAEALRLVASKKLDVEFTELVTGYRLRTGAEASYVDIYLYDSLSSGAGYAVSVADAIAELLSDMKELLSSCDCGSACSKCLKHYRNQYVHGMLDRFAALQLLEWGVDGIKASPIKPETQINMIMPLANILKQSGCEITADSEITAAGRRSKKKVVIYPAMWVEPHATNTIFVSDAYIKYAKPYAVQKILDNI